MVRFVPFLMSGRVGLEIEVAHIRLFYLAWLLNNNNIVVPQSSQNFVTICDNIHVSVWNRPTFLNYFFLHCHPPYWSTDRQLRRFDGYFRLDEGIYVVVNKMLESSGTSLGCRTFSRISHRFLAFERCFVRQPCDRMEPILWCKHGQVCAIRTARRL